LPQERGRTGAGNQLAPTRLFPKSIVWVGSSKDDISTLPRPVKASLGHRLRQVQDGETPLDMKSLTQFGTGVFELRDLSTKTHIVWCMS
jgi:phage-related protein